ncbi:MAG: hypothetical protein GTO42_01150 [Candidatus Latescibacteria bacterium]|nr:hypothetical protein [Candidatus Latescibacterota bacterium]NIO27136.1 hypothetical protein [Candidatus Latescibacterota bacterium]NIO54660.1 hypothetical protein [Candidatus Latescibacterota bacterium]NIT00743.1 hypothetical protein [Candidatus Latescibacterota bacterium]NIT37666.1 hypothetical protein [Candidatus Latescibacterota bacterium]
MKKHTGFLYRSTYILAIFSTGFSVYNMLATMIYKNQIFIERDMFSSVEILILIGFGLILVFDIVSILWILLRKHPSRNIVISDIPTMVFGTLCLVSLPGEKVMVDEIGREYLLGWEVLGEWIILYIFLTIQLTYNLVILLQLFRACNAQYGEGKI